MKTYRSISKFMQILLVYSLFSVNNIVAQVIDKLPSQVEEFHIEEIHWAIKAFHPQTQSFMDVVAIDQNGNQFNLKAIQQSDDRSILDVKAFVNRIPLSVKLVVRSDEIFFPVKAIAEDGSLFDVKARTEDGKLLDIKGVSKSGHIIHIRALSEDFERLNIIAISPSGDQNTVKGIKLLKSTIETIENGVPIYAHVKAMQ